MEELTWRKKSYVKGSTVCSNKRDVVKRHAAFNIAN